jgi:hypothetical protein
MRKILPFSPEELITRDHCRPMRSRIEADVAADGHFIEYLDSQYVSLLIFFYFNEIGRFSAVL